MWVLLGRCLVCLREKNGQFALDVVPAPRVSVRLRGLWEAPTI